MADILRLQLFAFEVKQAEGIFFPGLGVDEKSPRNRAHKQTAMRYKSHKEKVEYSGDIVQNYNTY